MLHAAWQVMEGPDFDPEKRQPKGLWFVSSWAFVLEPSGADKTRMMVRVRAVGGPPWRWGLLRLVLLKGDTVAHSTMLAGIRRRGERRYRIHGQ